VNKKYGTNLIPFKSCAQSPEMNWCDLNLLKQLWKKVRDMNHGKGYKKVWDGVQKAFWDFESWKLEVIHELWLLTLEKIIAEKALTIGSFF